jgi:hypothetical protein
MQEMPFVDVLVVLVLWTMLPMVLRADAKKRAAGFEGTVPVPIAEFVQNRDSRRRRYD